MSSDYRPEAPPSTRVIRVIREEDGKRVINTDDFDDGVEGMAATLFPDRLRIDVRCFIPGELYFDVPLDLLARMWADANKEVAH
jgi:hypothetical protein